MTTRYSLICILHFVEGWKTKFETIPNLHANNFARRIGDGGGLYENKKTLTFARSGPNREHF